ncbi:hypothetical protein P3L10_029721 [Capsicum annuum]
MDIGLAVGGAFLSSASNVLFDRLDLHGDLLKMFQKHKLDVGLLEKLEDILLGLQIVLSDAENKKASNPLVRKWMNKLQRAVDGAENFLEEVNYEALRLKVESQHPNLAETSNQQKEIEIERLIDRLLSNDANGKNLIVVPIVGMGGVGKTTLAKAVYNDKEVKDHFDLKAWFCVSETYDALRITKGKTNGKKFLIVLDDVWNDNYNEWDDLRNIFVQGDNGSKIIVTTRKESVALMMRTEQISMDTLSIYDSWSLFKRQQQQQQQQTQCIPTLWGLGGVGKQIVAKCKGLPLALKTLAVLLRSETEVEGWRRILRSEIWDLSNNDILPTLMLSYNELPPHLKPCFSYCAIFPKDYPFRKEQVIHLWIANGLVVPRRDEGNKDLGNQYFNELRSRSLFERVSEFSERDGGKFLMHDLVNDLAQIASSKLLQLSLINCKDCFSLPALGQLPSLKFLSIRDMHRITEVTEEFCGSSSYKKSFNSLEKLEFAEMPKWKQWHVLGNGEFPTLQNLSIEDCPKLIGKFPENLCSLTKLRISRCPKLNLETPIQLSSLKKFEVDGSLKAGVVFDEAELFTSQLQGMKQIEELSIGNCNSLTSLPTSTLPNNLTTFSSQALKSLTSLEYLRTCSLPQIQSLLEQGLPSSLSKLYLSDHDELHSLPTEALGHLTSLQSLEISNCHQLQSLPESELPSSLSKLTIYNCPNLYLTSLECLYIGNLPQIQSLLEQRLLSSLSELSICHCPNLQSLPESAFPSSISKLTIEDCRNLQCLPGEYWPEIAHIPEIYISVAILRRMPVMINKKEAPTDELFNQFAEKLRSAQMLEE